MSEIDKINDKFFRKIFENIENVRPFLKKILPEKIKKRLDFSTVKIDPTAFVSNEFKDFYSDIVVKVKMISKSVRKISTDIYFILEHKTRGHRRIFIQILKYMVSEWEKDINNNKPLRVIIPIVFYHGKEKWNVPPSFNDQFDIDDEVKEFLLNYRYVLFDTEIWNFRDENNKELRNNVLLFTALVLMKCAYYNDVKTIEEISSFWHKRGLTKDIESIKFFLTYIIDTQDIGWDELQKILEKSKINGGEIMETLARKIREEGIKIGEGIGEKRGEERGEERGIQKKARETAKKLLEMGIEIEKISEATGLKKEEIKKLKRIPEVH
jgi:predicted transposase/invertase (TIGR01784 family)